MFQQLEQYAKDLPDAFYNIKFIGAKNLYLVSFTCKRKGIKVRKMGSSFSMTIQEVVNHIKRAVEIAGDNIFGEIKNY